MLWDDDSIQFPRLICEIIATQELDLAELGESMDLEPADLNELFERAHVKWEQSKKENC
jgi:hypothetical protein